MKFFSMRPDRKDRTNLLAEFAVSADHFKPCADCGRVPFEYRDHLDLAIRWQRDRWNPNRSVVTDFTWPGGLSNLVVSERAKSLLCEVSSVSFTSVSILPFMRASRSTRSRGKLDDVTSVQLWYAKTSSVARLDCDQSHCSITMNCKQCGSMLLERETGFPMVIIKSNWDGAELFRIAELGGVHYVTEPLMNRLEVAKLSNVRFHQVGEMRG